MTSLRACLLACFALLCLSSPVLADTADACTAAGASADERVDADPAAALAAAERLLATAQAAGDLACTAQALVQRARAQRYLGRLGLAEAGLRQAIELARGAGLVELHALALARLGQAYEAGGDLPQALAALTEAVALAAPYPLTRAHALNLLGHVHHVAGRPAEAERTYREALQLYEDQGAAARTASVLLNLAVNARTTGALDEAQRLTQRALRQFEQQRDPRGVAQALHSLGIVQLELGQLDQALDSQREALVLRERLGDHFGAAISRTSLARVLLARAASAASAATAATRWRGEAIGLLQQAAAWLQAEQSHTQLLATLRLLAEAHAANGEFERAYARQLEYDRLEAVLFNEQSDRRFSEFAQRFELDRQAAELAGARAATRHAQAQAAARQRVLHALLLACALGLAAIVALAMALRNRHKVQQATAARRLAEQQLLAAIHGAPAGILVVDAAQRVLQVNGAALQALGLGVSAPEDWIGKPVARLRERLLFSDLDGRPLSAEQLPLAQVLQSGRSSEQRELEVGDGRTQRRVLVGAAPVFGQDKSVAAAAVAIIDITELRGVEREQERLRTRLLAAERSEAIHLALGGLAHEFSNQLAVALGYADLLALQLPDSEDAVQLQDALGRTSDLVRQLQLLAGYALTQPQPLQPAELVQQVQEALQMVHPRAQLDCSLENGLPTLPGDAKLLRQALSELLTNALEAGPQQQRIGLAVYQVRDTQGLAGSAASRPRPCAAYLVFSVTDDGPGMGETVRKRAFDPYFTTRPNGRGLGLSMVAGIVRAHHGGIWLESAPGAGTRVSLVLPVEPVRPRTPEGRSTVHSSGGAR